MRYWQKIRNEREWAALKSVPEFTSEESELSGKGTFYFDMDGVLAVFNKNAPMEEVFSKGYFRGLEPHRSVVRLAWMLQNAGYDVRILSKSVWSAVEEKHAWLNEHMPWLPEDKMYFVPIESDKSKFVPHEGRGAILVDDYNPNLIDWNGVAVKCVTDINNPNQQFYNFPFNFPDMAVTMLEAEAVPAARAQARELPGQERPDEDVER